MTLLTTISILFVGGIGAWCLGRIDARLPRWGALLAILIDIVYFGQQCVPVLQLSVNAMPPGLYGNSWFFSYTTDWIPQFGIHLALGVDGLSLALNLLTLFLGLVALSSAWDEIVERSGFFYFNNLYVYKD